MISSLFLTLTIGILNIPSTFCICTKNSWRLISPPSNRPVDFCIRQATLLRPFWVRELSNGTCLLFGQCSGNNLQLYHRLLPGSRSLLLRCRADRDCDPYTFLIDSRHNATVVDDSDISSNTDEYKSPMVDLQGNAFSHIQLLLINASGDINVNLTFSLNPEGRIQDETTWFVARNLVAANPWNVDEMKIKDFTVFKLLGNISLKVRFFIKTGGGGCDGIKGYLRIFPTEGCRWGHWTHPMSYVWTNGDVVFDTHARHSIEFRLYGTFANSYKVIDE